MQTLGTDRSCAPRQRQSHPACIVVERETDCEMDSNNHQFNGIKVLLSIKPQLKKQFVPTKKINKDKLHSNVGGKGRKGMVGRGGKVA